jgi:para-aminobenzoate synthetase/4-amino-4-deoxychorismate lyase
LHKGVRLNITNGPAESFVLLDDCTSSPTAKNSRLYTNLKKEIYCTDAAKLNQLLEEMQRETRNGLHAVGCFTYELGAKLMGISHHAEERPLAEFLLFERCEYLTFEEVTLWLDKKCAADVRQKWQPESLPAGVMHVQESVDENRLFATLAKIRDLLASGDTYQVNFTYRLAFESYGDPWALYRRLRQRQPVPYGALLCLSDGRAVLSLSPELFLRHESGRLTACPMKGTAQATHDEKENAHHALRLATDPKTVAENVMIVDLLRNDLGRIAVTGTVNVPSLFDVNRFGNVLQMTSTIEALLLKDATLSDVFNAVYPCGSITGAPKRRTMQIIQDLEGDVRGFYTGAIGWFDAPTSEQNLGDFCLSVPIRTIELQPPGKTGLRTGAMGIGAGIVYDSVASDEVEECRLKGRFLTDLPHQFHLIETMYATAENGIRHLNIHMARLRRSAATFGFRLDEVGITERLRAICTGLSSGPQRIKLSLTADGKYNVRTDPIIPLTKPARVMLADGPIKGTGELATHKTSWRSHYDEAIRIAEKKGAFDMVFYNSDDQLTEGARSNIFLKINGRWYSPPLALGILPGVMRTVIMNDPYWQVAERTLNVADLQNAEAMMVCNALRGPVMATLMK